MTELTGGAYGPSPRGWLDETDLRELAGLAREVLERHAPSDPDRPRSRWEQRRVEGELVWVEVERLEPPPDHDIAPPRRPAPSPPPAEEELVVEPEEEGESAW